MMTWKTHRVQVKTHAKFSLPGNFLKGVIAAALSFVATMLAVSFQMPMLPYDQLAAATTIDEFKAAILAQGDLKVMLALLGISTLLLLLLTSPLNVIGKSKYYLSVVRGQKPKFSTFLTPFTDLRQVFSACSLTVISFIWQFILAIILLAPSIALFIFSPVLGPLALIGSGVAFLVAFFLLLVLCTPFTLAPFALADKPERGAIKSILIARKRLKGARLEFLVFNFSFILWELLFGLNAPGVFLIEPYISASMAGFYDTCDACKTKK